MIDHLLNEIATVWRRTVRDVYGQYSYSSPEKIICKWQDKISLVINSNGQEQKAQSVIYTNVDLILDLDDKIILGDNQSNDPPPSANNIIAIEQLKGVDNSEILVKLWV